ncbi:NAD-dependent malic enzyme [Cutibacterium acnes JCM 18916]|nr:NAD-dependent malic enzyme [Cutibacterium acnes JCM 18916]
MERLNDDGYLGVRHPRVRGERYDEFVQQYVETAHRMFPHALLHWRILRPATPPGFSTNTATTTARLMTTSRAPRLSSSRQC